MKLYSTDPTSMFYCGSALRADFEALPLDQQLAHVAAALMQRAPWGRLRSWGSDLAWWALRRGGRYPDGRVFYCRV